MKTSADRSKHPKTVHFWLSYSNFRIFCHCCFLTSVGFAATSWPNTVYHWTLLVLRDFCSLALSFCISAVQAVCIYVAIYCSLLLVPNLCIKWEQANCHVLRSLWCHVKPTMFPSYCIMLHPVVLIVLYHIFVSFIDSIGWWNGFVQLHVCW